MIPSGIDAALQSLPEDLLRRSGSVFYSGRQAFAGNRQLYLLGLNPGGNPALQADQTVAQHISAFRLGSEPWSAYLDESWSGSPPGSWGMQPRIRHMAAVLGIDLRAIPSSNLIFARSSVEADLKAEKARLLHTCWPVHQAVLSELNVRAVLCLGGTVGRWVRTRLNASERIDIFQETNARGWRSETHRAADDRLVITVTHPGRADWRNPAADPSPLIRRALDLVA